MRRWELRVDSHQEESTLNSQRLRNRFFLESTPRPYFEEINGRILQVYTWFATCSFPVVELGKKHTVLRKLFNIHCLLYLA